MSKNPQHWLLARFHWVNTIAMVLLVIFLEYRRLGWRAAFTDPHHFIYVLAVDFLFLALLLTAGWLLLRLAQHVFGRVLSAVYVGVLVSCYLLLVLGQIFFLKTGSQLTTELVLYVIRHFAMLHGMFTYRFDAGTIKYLGGLTLMLATIVVASHYGARIMPWCRRGAVLLMVSGAGASVTVLATSREAGLYQYRGVFYSALVTRDFIKVGVEDIEPVYIEPAVVTAPQRARSVFVVVLESLRADVVTATDENGELLAPNLNRLTQDFRAFNNSYTTISHTSNALVGIFCGMFAPLEMTIRVAQPGDLRAHCLPRMLRDGGYATAFFQSADGDFENRHTLVDNMGFAHFADSADIKRITGQRVGYIGSDDKAIVSLLRDWLRQQRADRPDQPVLAATLNILTHDPYEIPQHGCAELATDARRCYLRAVRYVDAYVGELLAMLKDEGYYDDSIIIITGDHGEAFGEHGVKYHDVVPYQEVIRVPMWVRGLGDAGVDNALRQHLDILPTVTQLLGMELSGRLPGRSLTDAAGHEQVYTFCWYRPSCMSRVGRDGSKTIFDFDTLVAERYDLNADPGERDPLQKQHFSKSLYPVLAPLAEYRRSIDQYWQ